MQWGPAVEGLKISRRRMSFGQRIPNGGCAIITAHHPFHLGGHCMTLDVSAVRSQFPSLNRPAIFFDNPGGTQIAKQSLDRINKYLIESNANHEGAFATSIASDAVLDEAHRAMADFYNAAGPEEIVFGNN